MTPAGWMLDPFIFLGFGWAFGGVLPCMLLGLLLGRAHGTALGAGSALLLWGVGNLLVAALVVVYVEFDSTVLTLQATRCEPSADRDGQPLRTFYYAVQRPGEPAHEARTPAESGACPAGRLSADGVALRLRKDALASAAPLIAAEEVEGGAALPAAITWGVFGVFGSFAGGMLLAHHRDRRGHAPPPAPVAPWRLNLGRLLGSFGGLLLLAAFIAPWLLGGSMERGLVLGLRTGATGLFCWIAAMLLGGERGAGAGAAFLCLFALAMLGVAALLRAT
ncbi:MAG: hypothetical protein LCI02_24670 [Proteobacteria bacterium]|nr:hypothetical protein [Pseudomonadota bacterium]